jgi:hypothetical protein
MTIEKRLFAESAPCRWSAFAIIDPANPREWTPATLSSSGLITTDYDIYYVEDPRLTYWAPLPDVPPVAETTFVRTDRPDYLAIPKIIAEWFQQVAILVAVVAAFAVMFLQVGLIWLVAAPVTTVVWWSEGRRKNRTWVQEFVNYADILKPANYYPDTWQKYRDG